MKPASKQKSIRSSLVRYILILCRFFEYRVISLQYSLNSFRVFRDLRPDKVELKNFPTSPSRDPSNAKYRSPSSLSAYPNGCQPAGKPNAAVLLLGIFSVVAVASETGLFSIIVCLFGDSKGAAATNTLQEATAKIAIVNKGFGIIWVAAESWRPRAGTFDGLAANRLMSS